MSNHKPTTPVIHNGKYTILPHRGGGFTVQGKEMRDRGFYVPSREYLIRQYRNLKRGRPAKVTWTSLRTMIGYYAVMEHGVRSTVLGYEDLGIASKNMSQGTKEKAVRAFWSPEMIEDYYNGRRNHLPTLTDFERAHHRIYRSIARGDNNGMKKIIERVYDPKIYPDLYYEIRTNKSGTGHEVDTKELGRKLFERFCEGKSLQRTDLRFSPLARERKLFKRVISLGKSKVLRKTRNQIEREKRPIREELQKGEITEIEAMRRFEKISPYARTYTGVVEALTGLGPSDISLSQHARKEYAEITEDLTQCMFLWAFKTGVHLPFASPDIIYSTGYPVNFVYGGGSNKGYADLRLGRGPDARNLAIEIKTGAYMSTNQQLESIVEKYVPGETQWLSGEKMDNILVVIHEEPERSQLIGPALKKAGIQVVEYAAFHKYLAQVVEKMKRLYSQEIANLRPRLHNLDYLLDLHETISLKPQILLRGSNSEQREWTLSVLKSLIKEGEKRSNGTK